MQAIAQPLTLPCGATIPNRLVKAAMTEGLADPLNQATEELVTLYRRWAEGGAGLLITGNVLINRHCLERAGNVVVEETLSKAHKQILEEWAKAGTCKGNHLWMQINHAGRQTPAALAREPVAPSAIQLQLAGAKFNKPRALKIEEIEKIINRFANVATVAKEVGFTGVQIHSAHGYLISEFLSPRFNQRTDEWGGSLENRARILLEIIKRTREKVGRDFPISVKLNSTDFQRDGFSYKECVEVVKWLGEVGIDLLEISGGNYEQPKMVGVSGLEPFFEDGELPSTRAREAYFMAYAAGIRQHAKMPLMVTGGFRTRTIMNAAIDHEGIEAIGLARPLCVDTHLPQGLLEERIDVATKWEKKLRFGPGIFGVNSPIALIKAMNTWGVFGWFYLQLQYLGHGLEPDTRMGVFKALRLYQKSDKKAIQALKR